MRQTSTYRKDSVIITTIGIISELGIQGLTSKEIARREEISEGTLFGHFKNMDEIILAVLNYHSELDAIIIETVEAKNLSPIDSIMLFVSIYAENYENYPESTCLINISKALLQQGELVKQAEKTIDTRIAYLLLLIEKAQISENINPAVNSQILIDVITGSFSIIAYRWRKSNYAFKFKEQVTNTLEIILKTFR